MPIPDDADELAVLQAAHRGLREFGRRDRIQFPAQDERGNVALDRRLQALVEGAAAPAVAVRHVLELVGEAGEAPVLR